jgi:endonuclease VIII
MPEGHTLHRIARRHGDLFAGRPIETWSPQGRFAAEAAVLDGHRLDEVRAYGKHLFYRWHDAPTLHVHLGLVGTFRTWSGTPPPPPTSGTRLAMRADGATTYLAGPMACRLVSPDEEQDITGSLGPDPIASRRGRAEFARRLGAKRAPIAAALLDQAVVAGIGNVFRAELLFLVGVHPDTPAADLTPVQVDELWDLTVVELRRGVARGRIVTVRPREVGTRGWTDLDGDERLYVYHRNGLPCRRCATPIRMKEVAGRRTWWCPTCQPEGE